MVSILEALQNVRFVTFNATGRDVINSILNYITIPMYISWTKI